jgi:hypothetical protein
MEIEPHLLGEPSEPSPEVSIIFPGEAKPVAPASTVKPPEADSIVYIQPTGGTPKRGK